MTAQVQNSLHFNGPPTKFSHLSAELLPADQTSLPFSQHADPM